MYVVKVLHRFRWSLLNVFKRFFTKLNFSLSNIEALESGGRAARRVPAEPHQIRFFFTSPCMPLHLATP